MTRREAADWDGAAYHRVSSPQLEWGRKVLARLTLAGDETVLDAGCGSGRLTADLLDRLPRGRALAVDLSESMLREARATLARQIARERAATVRADLTALPFAAAAAAVFSTATFHWIKDHDALFRSLHAALRQGGRLVAQCGGGPNLARAHALTERVMHEHPYAAYFGEWREPWHFASPDDTAARLRAAGFVDVETWLEEAPTPFPGPAEYRAFMKTVVLRNHLARLPDERQRERFLDDVTAVSGRDCPAYHLDYWRLNISARRPAG